METNKNKMETKKNKMETKKNKMETNKNKMEAEGHKKVEELIKQKQLSQEKVLKIVTDGCDDFEKEFGRPMSYSEMRARYG